MKNTNEKQTATAEKAPSQKTKLFIVSIKEDMTEHWCTPPVILSQSEAQKVSSVLSYYGCEFHMMEAE